MDLPAMGEVFYIHVGTLAGQCGNPWRPRHQNLHLLPFSFHHFEIGVCFTSHVVSFFFFYHVYSRVLGVFSPVKQQSHQNS